MTETVQQPADMIARLGRKWGWVLAYGIITLAAGVAVLVWPSETLLVIAVLFGIQLIVSGIFRFVAALAIDDLSGGTRVLLALLAVLSIIVGLWAVRHVSLTLLAPGCCYLTAIRRSGPASSGVSGSVSAARGTGPITTASPSISTPCSS